MRVELAEYNPEWPKIFEQEHHLLLKALGKPIAKIEHIGSTAVTGLVSKPIIDIMIGLYNFSDADNLVPQIINLGYIYHPEFEDMIPERRFFKKVINDKATHHIHMVEIKGELWQRHLLFRNYLRANPEIAKEYGIFKKELSKRDWKNSNDFAEAKSKFIRKVEKHALIDKKIIPK